MKELHQSTLYRTQRLIRMGEWLERNSAAICLAFEVIDRAHDSMMEPDSEDKSANDILEIACAQQMSAIRALYPILGEINSYTDWGVEMGQDVTLHHPNNCKDHRYEVVIEAPKPFEATKQQIADLPVVTQAHKNLEEILKGEPMEVIDDADS